MPKRFVGGLSAETIGALLPSPPLRRWVVVVLWPRRSKWLSVDWSACSWIKVVIARGCACLWIGVGFNVVGFGFGLLDFQVVVGLFCGGCICIILL